MSEREPDRLYLYALIGAALFLLIAVAAGCAPEGAHPLDSRRRTREPYQTPRTPTPSSTPTRPPPTRTPTRPVVPPTPTQTPALLVIRPPLPPVVPPQPPLRHVVVYVVPVKVNAIPAPPGGLQACEDVQAWARLYPTRFSFECRLEPERTVVMSHPTCTGWMSNGFPPGSIVLAFHGLSCAAPAYADYSRNVIYQSTSGVFSHEAGHVGLGHLPPLGHTSQLSGPDPLPKDFTSFPGAQCRTLTGPTRRECTYPDGRRYTVEVYATADRMGKGSGPLIAPQAARWTLTAVGALRRGAYTWYFEQTAAGSIRVSVLYGDGALIVKTVRKGQTWDSPAHGIRVVNPVE